MCSHTSGVVIYSRFHQNPFMSHGGGFDICPVPLFWLLAFATAYTTVQIVLFCSVSFLDWNMNILSKVTCFRKVD